jgi:uncharacterized iron-regulated membrane protein
MKMKPGFMMGLRRVLFWMHLTAGVTAGLVILVMSLTGVLLTYERQLTEWADDVPVVTPPPEGGTPFGLEALAERARAARATWPDAITVRAEPNAPVAFGVGREALFLDPYSGAVLGEGSSRARSFFRTVTDWHRWLGQSGDARSLARAVTGAANVVFLFIVLSGIYLWWPKSLRLQHLRPITAFQGDLAGKARDFNWHNVFGFWSALPLAFVVASGVVMSYPWANDLVYRLAGSEPPRRGPAPAAGSGWPRGRSPHEREARGHARRARPRLGDRAGPDVRLADGDAARPDLTRGALRVQLRHLERSSTPEHACAGRRRPLDRRGGAPRAVRQPAARPEGPGLAALHPHGRGLPEASFAAAHGVRHRPARAWLLPPEGRRALCRSLSGSPTQRDDPRGTGSEDCYVAHVDVRSGLKGSSSVQP